MNERDVARILIVDDNRLNNTLAANELREEGLRIEFAVSGSEAMDAIRQESFDLILLDVMMPDMDGFETCTRLKEIPRYRDVPVIFLTARDDKESVLRGFECGAVDYIARPFFGPEFVSRVRTHLRLRKAISDLEDSNAKLQRDVLEHIATEQELRQSQEQMAGANMKLVEQATRDALTGLLNRRQIHSIASYEHDRLQLQDERMSLILCDIDFFKDVNDELGHDCGDVVLRDVAKRLEESVRKHDHVGRWGGEEFLIVLPGTGTHGAQTVAEKVRRSMARATLACEQAHTQITMTFGVTECARSTPLKDAIRRADQALLRGKRDGRDRVVVDDQ